jgi:hypothetical protein
MQSEVAGNAGGTTSAWPLAAFGRSVLVLPNKTANLFYHYFI